ncbi:replication-relaxation family protein [Streptomyces sp. NPDC006430]|uniref:replication-relaxation family protein n=1 Tax=Streptomyces sp. NPDC006430 TaxID=3154299 RepID=UPI0033A0CDC7
MAGRRLTNPAGSSNDLRGDVLRVLGVLKVATADQIQRIASPHLTYRHTTKATASERKTARTAAHAGALSDLRRHGLAENGGTTRAGESLRNLTTKGLEAASYELGRPLTEMGSTARGAGSSGATHPMAVNETIIAMLRPKPDLRLLTPEPPEAKAAAQAAADAPGGIGTIASYATEAPLPATGTWGAPGKGGAQADIVLTAPQDQIPLLFIEVDNCHETAEEIAAKLLKYSRFFKRTIKDTDGKDKSMWRTRWMARVAERGEAPHPPVLIVFNHIGARDPNRTVPRLQELTRPLWAGEPADGFSSYDRKIPIIATGLRNLRAHGPNGPVFLRFGRTHMQPLRDAIGNPRRDAVLARRAERARAQQEEYQEQLRRAAEQKRAEREAARPACVGCGTKFDNDRWENTQLSPEPGHRWHPTLCEPCEAKTVAAADQAERDRLEAEAAETAETAEKARGWRSRFRPGQAS